MKIIGLTSEGVILEASNSELSALSGRSFRTSDYDYSGNPRPYVGLEFNVLEAYRQIHRNDNRKREIAAVKQQLTAIITQLDMVEPFMQEPDPAPQQEEIEVNLTGECWDVQWLSKDGAWMPHNPYMSHKEARKLFDDFISLRPKNEKFRLVRVSTLVDVFDEGNGLGDRGGR